LWSVNRTDVACRAVPLARLILTDRRAPDDLNVRWDQGVSVALVGLAVVLGIVSPLRMELPGIAAGALGAVLIINRRWFGFLRRERGIAFSLMCVPLHLLYFLYSGLSVIYVWLALHVGSASSQYGTAIAADRAPHGVDDGP
jgi:hypothetical protein